MAGTVVKWLVEPGAAVSAGDPVVVLEAMKMETQVSAHRDGTRDGPPGGGRRRRYCWSGAGPDRVGADCCA